MDRALIRELRAKVEAAAQEAVGDGFIVEFGNGRFDERQVTLKMTIRHEDAPDNLEQDFKSHCRRYGLSPDDFGQTFESFGTSYTVVGIKPNSRKYPIIAERGDGKRFKFDATQVRRALERATA